MAREVTHRLVEIPAGDGCLRPGCKERPTHEVERVEPGGREVYIARGCLVHATSEMKRLNRESNSGA
jgi:putative heme iron utilization protein